MLHECSNCAYYEKIPSDGKFRITDGKCLSFRDQSEEWASTCGHWGSRCERFKLKQKEDTTDEKKGK